MDSSVSDCCWNCQQKKGTFFHMVWTPKIKSFWESVIQSLGGIIGHHVVCDPTLCLLNYMDKGARPKYNKQIIIIGLMTAKRLIATNWKDADHRKKKDGCKLSWRRFLLRELPPIFWKGVMRNILSYGEK